MIPYPAVLLLLFLVLVAALLIRFVNASVDREFRNLARAVSDDDYRHGEIARMNRALETALPLPPDAPRLERATGGGRAALPAVLFAVGVILAWGGLLGGKDGALWLYAGLAAVLLSAAIMLATLRKRKWERTARLLRFRADLRRLDGDHAGSAADLRELLKLTPADDAAWAELSDDLASQGDLDGALEAVKQASSLDPVYDEYRLMETSLAIRLGRLDQARSAMRAWIDLDRVQEDDPRAVMYRAAIDLAAGARERAEAAIRTILLDKDDPVHEFLDSDQALKDVRDLLPGRE